jgi:hypothetical protein
MPDKLRIDSRNQLSWYHCGRCGSLFQSVENAGKDRRCSECGSNPIPVASDKSSLGIQFPTTESRLKNKDKQAHGEIRKAVTRKKNNSFITKLVLAWALVTALIVLAARFIWHSESPEKTSPKNTASDAATQNENLYLLNKAMGQCMRTMHGFLQAGPPEQRSQFVIQPITAVTRMTRHREVENWSEISPPAPETSEWKIVSLGDEKAIETNWANADGRGFDAIFRKEGNEWLIDWEHFVRYSDMPFSVFLSGNGDAEGEFRLLARERLADERKNMSTISLMFYAPIFGLPADTASPSPEFLVDRNSPEGQLLKAAFSALKNKKRPFDAKLANHDPEGMIRVRVKIRRSGEMDTRAFKITELKACHWYSSDLPGFDLNQEINTNN